MPLTGTESRLAYNTPPGWRLVLLTPLESTVGEVVSACQAALSVIEGLTLAEIGIQAGREKLGAWTLN